MTARKWRKEQGVEQRLLAFFDGDVDGALEQQPICGPSRYALARL